MTNEQKIEELRENAYRLLDVLDGVIEHLGPKHKLTPTINKLRINLDKAVAMRIYQLSMEDPQAKVKFTVPAWAKLTVVAALGYLAHVGISL